MSLFREFFDPQASALTTAQYTPTPGAGFPPAPSAAPSAAPLPPDASAPSGPALPPAAAPGSAFGPGLANLAGALPGMMSNHALTLMALGAGIAQGGIGKGLAAAEAAAQAERSLMAQQVSLSHVYGALTNAGVPADEALAAVANPSLMRTLAVKYLGPRPQGNGPNGTAAPNASASNSGPTSGGWLASTAGLPPAPPSPANVADGSAFSHSRRQWRDAAGNLFDLQGKAVM
jgi:hypothetical protein